MPLFEGLLTGAAMIVFIGPVLFTLMQAALSYGYRGGLAVAIGIITSDILAIFICQLGASSIFTDESNRVVLAILAAVVLIGMASQYLLRPKFFDGDSIKLGALGFSGLVSKGFLVNFVNPFVFVVWIGVIAYAEKNHVDAVWIFIIGVLLGIFVTDNLKALYAGKLNKFLSRKRLSLAYKVIAILLYLSAARLLYLAYVWS